MPQNNRSSSFRVIPWAIIAVLFAIFYQINIYNILFVIFGFGRKLQSIDEFPWSCNRLYHPLVEGCEDMWLDHEGRKLYAACTALTSRQGWSPSGNKFNISARSRTDHIAVLDIDQAGVDELYGVRQLQIDGFDGDLDLHGFDALKIGDTIRFWLINHKPPVDPSTGQFLDAAAKGANSTVEIFDLESGSETLQYVKTVHSDQIVSPNDLAVDDDGVGFVITNDFDRKVGSLRPLETMLYGSGSLTYCRSDSGLCHLAAKENFHFPNGIAKDHGKDGFYYVVHSMTGIVSIHQLQQDGNLTQVNEISLGYPADNLGIDADGKIFAAGIPDVIKLAQSAENPYVSVAPATVISINKNVTNDGQEVQYNVKKVLEDKHAEVLPSTSVALHDAMSRRLFIAGLFSPFITICESIDEKF